MRGRGRGRPAGVRGGAIGQGPRGVTTDAWGIDDGWSDTAGRWHPAPPETLEAFRAAMGEPDPAGPPGRPVWVVRPGAADALPVRSHLRLEDGTDAGEL